MELHRRTPRCSLRRTALHRQRHPLVKRLPGMRLKRISKGKWSAIGLERTIRPVALILHLKQVAFKGEVRLDAILQRNREGGNGGEQRQVEPAFIALRSDAGGQIPAYRTVRADPSIGLSAVLGERVQQAKADAAIPEIAYRLAIHTERDRPIGRAREYGMPPQFKVARGSLRV